MQYCLVWLPLPHTIFWLHPMHSSKILSLDATIKSSMLSVLLRGFDLLFLRDPKTPKKFMDNKKMRVRPRWTSAFQLLWNFRDIGNPHVIKRVPPFSNIDKTYTPSRGAFLLQRTVTFSLCYLAMELISLSRKPGYHEVFLETNERLFSRLHDISREEALTRTMATLGFLVNTAFLLNAIYHLFSILLVGLGLNSPSYWAPSFSFFLEAYTIRRFWGQAFPDIPR